MQITKFFHLLLYLPDSFIELESLYFVFDISIFLQPTVHICSHHNFYNTNIPFSEYNSFLNFLKNEVNEPKTKASR